MASIALIAIAAAVPATTPRRDGLVAMPQSCRPGGRRARRSVPAPRAQGNRPDDLCYIGRKISGYGTWWAHVVDETLEELTSLTDGVITSQASTFEDWSVTITEQDSVWD
jgi:hypothetical protein